VSKSRVNDTVAVPIDGMCTVDFAIYATMT